MPNVISLQLHGNRMQPMTAPVYDQLPSLCFSQLRLLALNNCNIQTYKELVLISKCLANVEELYLSNNSLKDLSLYSNTLATTVLNLATAPYNQVIHAMPQLRILDISHCNIDSWAAILSLFVCHNCNADGFFAPNQSMEVMPNLTDLLIDGNAISSFPKRTPNCLGLNKLLRLSASSIK